MNSGSDAGLVIVGGGEAAAHLSGALRQMGYAAPISLISNESYPPYRRPPLSKAFLAGEVTIESLSVKSADAYRRQNIECRCGVGVESIDRENQVVLLDDGTSLSYHQLVLATGGRPRRLTMPGSQKPNVHYIRTIDDILRLHPQFVPGNRLLIIGGGYIGLEAASAGIKKGLSVTIVEAQPRFLARVTSPEVSAFYERAHRARGVGVITGLGVHAFDGESAVETAVLSNGAKVEVDLVIVGVGLIPNTELAEAAVLDVANGIVVDTSMRTVDPSIYAIGDCSNHENSFLRRRVRLESAPNAAEQARVCAAAICGKPVPGMTPPWFWSDQFDLKLQSVGLSQGYDQVAIRGDEAKDSFCAIYLQNGIIIAVDAVNRPGDFMVSKRLVADRVAASAEQLIDETVALKSLL